MKIQILILLFATSLIVQGLEVTEDNDQAEQAQLISYLLAKVQRLETGMRSEVAHRNIRQAEEKAVKPKEKNVDPQCPSRYISYIRWGNDTCPYGANTIYQGFAAGGHHDHTGSPANMLCLPPNPMRYDNNPGGSYYIYSVEYQTSGVINQANDRNMPCALCEVSDHSTQIMIPSHFTCPEGWRKEYNGYIMAGYYAQAGSSMYNCIDNSLEQIPGSAGDNGGHELHTIYATGSFIPTSSYALACVVCSK